MVCDCPCGGVNGIRAKAEGMGKLLGQGESLMAPLQGLVGITKKPQYQGLIG
jgi:hypothetical protein